MLVSNFYRLHSIFVTHPPVTKQTEGIKNKIMHYIILHKTTVSQQRSLYIYIMSFSWAASVPSPVHECTSGVICIYLQQIQQQSTE